MSFFVAAYAVLWLGLFLYLVWLAGRVRSLRAEARALAEESAAVPDAHPRSNVTAPR